MITMQQKPPLSTIVRKNIHQKLSHAIGWKKRGVRLSSRSRKTYGLIGELGAFSPGLAGSLQDKAFSRV